MTIDVKVFCAWRKHLFSFGTTSSHLKLLVDLFGFNYSRTILLLVVG